jgi:hypothetical protein
VLLFGMITIQLGAFFISMPARAQSMVSADSLAAGNSKWDSISGCNAARTVADKYVDPVTLWPQLLSDGAGLGHGLLYYLLL